MSAIRNAVWLVSAILFVCLPSLTSGNDMPVPADLSDRVVYREFDRTLHPSRRHLFLAKYSNTALVQGVSTGSKTAPYTLVIVDTYPVIDIDFITRFYRDVLPQLEKRYVRTDMMRIVSVPYMPVGDYGLALWCAEDQQMGWVYNQTTFANYSHAFPALDDSSDDRVDDQLAIIAEAVGLEVSVFRACVSERRVFFPREEDNTNRIAVHLNPLWAPNKMLNEGSILLARSSESSLHGQALDLTYLNAEDLIDWMDLTMTKNVAPAPGEETTKELVRSIYDFGVEYRVRAVKSAEDSVQHYDRNSYLRWEPISVDPDSVLAGSYLIDGAMPESIAITPFPDISIVADQTDYVVMEHIQSATWKGSIRGTPNGQVEISIVGGVGNPGFVIRFLNYTNLISIHPTDDAGDVYIAIEGNPHQVYLDEH